MVEGSEMVCVGVWVWGGRGAEGERRGMQCSYEGRTGDMWTSAPGTRKGWHGTRVLWWCAGVVVAHEVVRGVVRGVVRRVVRQPGLVHAPLRRVVAEAQQVFVLGNRVPRTCRGVTVADVGKRPTWPDHLECAVPSSQKTGTEPPPPEAAYQSARAGGRSGGSTWHPRWFPPRVAKEASERLGTAQQ